MTNNPQSKVSQRASAQSQRSAGLKRSLNFFKDQPRHPVHSFHRYFGKLIPAIPAFAISEFTSEGDLVVDAFCGSGTTSVESLVAGRKSVSVDRNGLATFVARAKTRHIPQERLMEELEEILNRAASLPAELGEYNLPYVVNLDHWFREEVLLELLRLRASIDVVEREADRDFFRACFSAFLRGVSNADPQHVFPGYSKRMRALDASGRVIDVHASFLRSVKKRSAQVGSLPNSFRNHKFVTGDATSISKVAGNADLAVINPPYISSIRYLETMKIEMGWLGFVTSKDDYLAQDRKMIGSERVYKAELEEIHQTGLRDLDDQILRLRSINSKMAKVVFDYFAAMQSSFDSLRKSMRAGGVLVIKISDSQVRGELIPTHRYFTEQCSASGFQLIADFVDEFDQNSRSLLTARNTYSGIMNHDRILVLEAVR